MITHADCYDVLGINLSSVAELFSRNKGSFHMALDIVPKIKAESVQTPQNITVLSTCNWDQNAAEFKGKKICVFPTLHLPPTASSLVITQV